MHGDLYTRLGVGAVLVVIILDKLLHYWVKYLIARKNGKYPSGYNNPGHNNGAKERMAVITTQIMDRLDGIAEVVNKIYERLLEKLK